ncbi:MAG: hypothetical protein P8M78_04590 [Myxococcota bacterium]|nr:hypothetical protein [Myxococcota bacterium]
MLTRRLVFTSLLLVLNLTLSDGASSARPLPHPSSTVFVQTNKALGNTIQVFSRAADGTLDWAGEYETGGLGGSTAETPGDTLASQGSLTYQDGFLFAVNAGSNTLTLFQVNGTELERLQIVPTGGLFPVSVAVREGLVYVLNAGGDGTVQGYRLQHGHLTPINKAGLAPCPEVAGRSLDLSNTNPPLYSSAPGQVGISPNGRFVIVTTKSNDALYTYRIRQGGRLAPEPVISPSAVSSPVGFTFGRRGSVLVSEGGGGAVTRYRLHPDGSLTPTSPSVPNGQIATCWIQKVGRYFFVSNAGSSTISTYREGPRGQLLLVYAIAADTDGGGTIDLAASGGYLYVQNALAGTVDGYAVEKDGSLTLVTTITGLPAFPDSGGMEGIAASY